MTTQPVQSATRRPILKKSQSSPSGISKSTGFQQALRFSTPPPWPGSTGPAAASVVESVIPANSASAEPSSNTPSAASTGSVHLSEPFSLRLTQMHTSGLRSFVPPKYAATRSPRRVSAMVAAWHSAKGAEVYRNSAPAMAADAVGKSTLKRWRPEPTRLVPPPGRHTSAVVLHGTSTVHSRRPPSTRHRLDTVP